MSNISNPTNAPLKFSPLSHPVPSHFNCCFVIVRGFRRHVLYHLHMCIIDSPHMYFSIFTPGKFPLLGLCLNSIGLWWWKCRMHRPLWGPSFMAGPFVQGHGVYCGIFPRACFPGSTSAMIPGFCLFPVRWNVWKIFSRTLIHSCFTNSQHTIKYLYSLRLD